MKIGKTIEALRIGDTVEHSKTITEKDVEAFGEITQDYNPAHFDADYAAQTMFKKRISHGMLVGSLFSKLLGTDLPGYGTIYVGQTLTFLKPVYLGDTITARVEITDINKEKNRVILSCVAVNQMGKKVVVGEAKVMPPIQKEK